MSAGSLLCRVCLAGKVKIYCIEKIGLKEIYEKVTSIKLNPGDGRPLTICYICCFQLLRCVKFAEMSQRAEKTVTDLVTNGIEITLQILIMLDLGMIKNLKVTTTKLLSLDSNNINTEVAVKEEIIEGADKKHKIEADGIVFTSVCRVCLAGNVRAHCIETIGLQEIFEKVTGTKLNTGDGRPVTICYICRSQLQRCHRFCEMSRRAEKLLTDFNNSTEITQEAAPKLSIELVHNLSVTTTQFMSLNDYTINESYPVAAVKEEFNDEDSKSTLKKCIVKTYKTNSYYTCQFCSKNYKTKVSLVSHLQNHILDIPFACKQCNETFTSNSILKTHMKIHNRESYICDYCKKGFHIKNNMKRHMRVHTGEKPYNCNQCNKKFTQCNGLQRHMRFHTGDYPYICDRCKKAFYDQYHLKKHMIRHTGVKPYTCKTCGKGYYDYHNLQIHIRTHTGLKPYTCNRCSKMFSDKSNMLRHMKIHTGEKPFACKQCNMTFSRNFVFKSHMRIHTGIRPYSCSICFKMYTNNGNLKRHMNIHTGLKSYSCSMCDNSFSSNFDLKVHEKIHTKEKTTCNICNKTYGDSRTLKRHMRIHSGEKPYNCKQCNKTFSDKSNFQRHSKIHTGEKPYACNFCSKTYTRACYLQCHMKVHAKE